MDITEFLTACLEEEAAMARAAAAFYDDADQDGVSWEGHAGTDLNGYTRFWIAPHLGAVNDVASGLHINRHDPAHVLREVAAKRRVLERHHDDDGDGCYGCGFGNDEERMVKDVNDCPELRDMASIYDDRPGYKEEWKL